MQSTVKRGEAIEDKSRSWWQRIKKPLENIIIGIFLVGLLVLITLIVLGYIFNWDWTGLGAVNSEPKQHTKTLWDWLQLLIIPAVLAVGGYLFNFTVSRNEQNNTQLRDQTERDIAFDNQRNDALQAYIDKMSELLLHEKLRDSTEDDEVRKIARVRTLTVLPLLDSERKRSVLQFLYESGLIKKVNPIIDLHEADLRKASLDIAKLQEANLSGAKLMEANLSRANLYRADLSEANLSKANLESANLGEAVLNTANLDGAILFGAKLSGVKLSRATLRNANLRGANLYRADLSQAALQEVDLVLADLIEANLIAVDLYRANLYRANLFGAALSGSILREADLREAEITTEQLANVMSLQDATMPDGSKHP